MGSSSSKGAEWRHCDKCDGNGQSRKECGKCENTGQYKERACPKCDGYGGRCRKCNGRGQYWYEWDNTERSGDMSGDGGGQ